MTSQQKLVFNSQDLVIKTDFKTTIEIKLEMTNLCILQILPNHQNPKKTFSDKGIPLRQNESQWNRQIRLKVDENSLKMSNIVTVDDCVALFFN